MKVDRAVRLGGGRTDIPLALTVSGALCSGLPCDAEIYSLSPVRPGIALNLPLVEERLVECLVTGAWRLARHLCQTKSSSKSTIAVST
jgi:hypothetical protein